MIETKTIKQAATFAALPSEIYDLLMDSNRHAAFTGKPAAISAQIGGTFAAYGDHIRGKNLELVPGIRIVQEWRASDWPEGHFSVVRFEITPSAKGAKILLTQTDVPVEFAKSIDEGWKKFYWEKMKHALR